MTSPLSRAVSRCAWMVAVLVASMAAAGCGTSGGTAEAVTTVAEVPPAGPCPPPGTNEHVAIDWVPFVIVDAVTFQATHSAEATLPESALGDVVATVRCRIADTVVDPDFRPREGDAAFLPAGTPLRAVAGYRTDFRLAAWDHGTWRIYEASEVPGAKTGVDLLDIHGKVAAIHVVDGDRGDEVLRTVDDPATVERVVDAVLSAPVLADDARLDRELNEAPVFVRFDLVDGTTVQRAWHVGAGVLAGQIDAPRALTEVLQPRR